MSSNTPETNSDVDVQSKRISTGSTVLVAEDDEHLRDFMQIVLDRHGYQVMTAKNGVEAVSKCLSGPVNLILLDLMMPGMDGYAALEKIRFFSKVPILILSSFNNPDGVIKALSMGADGYIVKPFAVQEIMARINSILRRMVWTEVRRDQGSNEIVVGNMVIHKEHTQATVAGRAVQLTVTEHKILLCLAEEAGQTVSKEQILKDVWQHTFLDSAILSQNMHRLRNKLHGKSGGKQLIRTEYGVGYSLQAA
ncbi:MAG: response regulator transcription factor [Caldilineaceae bacterium]